MFKGYWVETVLEMAGWMDGQKNTADNNTPMATRPRGKTRVTGFMRVTGFILAGIAPSNSRPFQGPHQSPNIKFYFL